ncbi:MAG: SDR family oxidoreductase [bacterium]|nr:SDR family oxidoreductase [bacterium]
MTLLVGSTGVLGTEICRQMREQGLPVKAMVRNGADPAKVDTLKGLGVEFAEADLKEPSSVERACQGIQSVISTASSTFSRREGDSIQTVDLEGQSRLVDAAQAAGAEHFVFISFPDNPALRYPLTEAKRVVERRLQQCGLAYTILQASYFMEVWLTPMLGFDVANGQVKVYGQGKNKISWISYPDVARFAIKALSEPRARNQIIKVGGPEALSPLDVVRAFEAAGSKEIAVEHVPESGLRAQFEAAEDPMQKSFAALMVQYAAGDAMEMAETLRLLPVELTSVRDYASRTLLEIQGQQEAAHA